MTNVTIVSADGHAIMKPEHWAQYLEKEFHDEIPLLREETEIVGPSMTLLTEMALPPELADVYDPDHLLRSGRWSGLWEADVRLEELDREGIAAEFIFHGEHRAAELGYSPVNAVHSYDFVDAGVRAYDRWMVDTFGHLTDRFLLVGPTGSNIDLEATVRELVWVADHGFTGTFLPGFTHFEGVPPIHDPYWEPVWATHEAHDLALVIHGGYGFDQGVAYAAMKRANEEVAAEGGGTMDLAIALSQSLFNDEFFRDIRGRRAMWQLFFSGVFDRFSGVFDRHPGLKLFLTEVRGDWIPPTLRHLDALYDRHRDDIPAKRKPSEYWAENCMAGLSFMHKAEVEMRNEIGVDRMLFGRDYPHTEGTWPNTGDYLRALFAGVSEHDVRRILGENAIDFLGLDRAKLSSIGDKIGPSIEEITQAPDVDPVLVTHLGNRSGMLKPAEGADRVFEYEPMLSEDVAALATATADRAVAHEPTD